MRRLLLELLPLALRLLLVKQLLPFMKKLLLMMLLGRSGRGRGQLLFMKTDLVL